MKRPLVLASADEAILGSGRCTLEAILRWMQPIAYKVATCVRQTDDQDMRSALSGLLLSHIMQRCFAQRHHLTYLQGLLLKLL